MSTREQRRHALYSALPAELADLIRCALRCADRAERHVSTQAELAELRVRATDVRNWEDRQLRVTDALGDKPPTKPRKRRRALRVVKP